MFSSWRATRRWCWTNSRRTRLTSPTSSRRRSKRGREIRTSSRRESRTKERNYRSVLFKFTKLVSYKISYLTIVIFHDYQANTSMLVTLKNKSLGQIEIILNYSKRRGVLHTMRVTRGSQGTPIYQHAILSFSFVHVKLVFIAETLLLQPNYCGKLSSLDQLRHVSHSYRQQLDMPMRK